MMENAIKHLRAAVARSLATGAGVGAGERLLDGFRAERPPLEERACFSLAYPPALVLRGADWLLRDQGFNTGKGIDAERSMVQGHVERDLSAAPWIAALGSARRDWRVSFAAAVQAGDDGMVCITTSRSLPSWAEEFREHLTAHLRKTCGLAVEHGHTVHAALAGPSGSTSGETVLSPGEMLSRPFRGTLRDYSGCATEVQTRDLRAGRGGVLPLGRQLFERADGTVAKGQLLFLTPNPRTGALREHQGTLICAPQNSGKTELLVRWTRAANRAGYNLFLVDVKGNLLERLTRAGGLKGEMYHFTTDPLCAPGDPAMQCHALNFLDRLDPWTRLGVHRIRQLAETLLPKEGLESGEVTLFRRNWVNWLTTFIHLVLLDEFYAPFEDRRADLGDVCELASDEAALIACLRRIAAAETMNLAEGRNLPRPRLRDLFGEISVLLPQEEIVPAFGDTAALFVRRSEHSYRWLTETLAGMLRSFRSYGLLGDKVSGAHSLPRFSLEWVTGLDDSLRPSDRQVTVILAARDQEGDDARTILTLAIGRLEQALMERRRHAGRCALRPVLLMLDETRRIRNFKTNEYVSFARDSEAGCVVVYQSLGQVGNEEQIAELLENIGTQIYLGSLVRDTARHFVASLPKRHRPTFTLNSAGADGMGGVQIGQETIDYFSTADLYVLPAGDYPALVQINDQPRRRPILVSLDRAQGAAT
jgi:hypothetical protein